MKKAIVYTLALVMLLSCLAGCGRNEPMEEMPTPTPYTTTAPTPVPTARPTQRPNVNNNDGMVNDGNGIIDDNDGNAVTPPDKEDIPMDNDMLQNDLNNNGNSGAAASPGTTPNTARKVR